MKGGDCVLNLDTNDDALQIHKYTIAIATLILTVCRNKMGIFPPSARDASNSIMP